MSAFLIIVPLWVIVFVLMRVNDSLEKIAKNTEKEGE